MLPRHLHNTQPTILVFGDNHPRHPQHLHVWSWGSHFLIWGVVSRLWHVALQECLESNGHLFCQ